MSVKSYLICTTDSYELPVYVADSISEASKIIGCKYSVLRTYMSRRRRGCTSYTVGSGRYRVEEVLL